MNLNQVNGNKRTEPEVENPNRGESLEPPYEPHEHIPGGLGEANLPEAEQSLGFATRSDKSAATGLDKKKLIMLGGALLTAILFFAFTAIIGKSHSKPRAPQPNPGQQGKTQLTPLPKGSVTPLMETVRKPSPEGTDGQLSPEDIKRTRPTDGGATTMHSDDKQKPAKPVGGAGGALSSVPAFSDTQQRWEEPRPYGAASEPAPARVQQQQSALKEASLVFVRSQPQNASPSGSKSGTSSDDVQELSLTPGTRIEAKLKTEISSAVSIPVVAEIEYTYAIGDQILVPAGAKVYGQLQHADRSGNVGIKFDEIELEHGEREKIDAIGTDLDMGPIKGTVTGQNTGKNFLIRAASGIGSLAATLVGNNANASFSEGDLLRERISQNIGNAGDSELLSLSANSNVVVSVPADRKIYIVFTKHQQAPSTLRKVDPAAQ